MPRQHLQTSFEVATGQPPQTHNVEARKDVGYPSIAVVAVASGLPNGSFSHLLEDGLEQATSLQVEPCHEQTLRPLEALEDPDSDNTGKHVATRRGTAAESAVKTELEPKQLSEVPVEVRSAMCGEPFAFETKQSNCKTRCGHSPAGLGKHRENENVDGPEIPRPTTVWMYKPQN